MLKKRCSGYLSEKTVKDFKKVQLEARAENTIKEKD
jgi:hypothetical protein